MAHSRKIYDIDMHDKEKSAFNRRFAALFDCPGYCLAALACLALSAPVMAQDPTPLVVDDDHDGLIEIYTLNDLNNIRHNLLGTSYKTTPGATGEVGGCPTATEGRLDDHDHDKDPATPSIPIEQCYGYELEMDLDFDTNGNGRADAGDAFWNEGSGWEPIRDSVFLFGNHHTISNLFINRIGGETGLLGISNSQGLIRDLGLVNVNITATLPPTGEGNSSQIGSLMGTATARTRIINVYATGFISAVGFSDVGGLVGNIGGGNLPLPSVISESYAVMTVSGTSQVGGLVGRLQDNAEITSSYALATVSGEDNIGGLVGASGTDDGTGGGKISDSYAVAAVLYERGTGSGGGGNNIGGFIGSLNSDSMPTTNSYTLAIVNSVGSPIGGFVGLNETGEEMLGYFNRDFTDLEHDVRGQTTMALQELMSNTDIYDSWNDELWDFGEDDEYPGLVLPQWAERTDGVVCPTIPGIIVEERDDDCVHRPEPVSAFSFRLHQDDETGASKVDGITNKMTSRLTGQVYPPTSSVRISFAEHDDMTLAPDAAGAFTTNVTLAEGLNRFELDIRPSGAPNFLGPISELEVILDTQAPMFMLFRRVNNEIIVRTADTGTDLIFQYEELAADDSGDCMASFSGTNLTDYIEGTFLPALTGGAVYCFIATDLAGNRGAVLSSANAPVAADIDGNGLIEIYTLADLNNIRHDLRGASSKTSASADPITIGCPASGCNGYELMTDLNFDTDDSGRVDAGDDVWSWNGGDGWEPIGTNASAFTAVFEGNGHILANLFISRDAETDVGLFGSVNNGEIRNLGLINANISGGDRVGGLAGVLSGGSAIITASFAGATVSGNNHVGGLVGRSAGAIAASYAASAVSGNSNIGGLVGQSAGAIAASYSVSTVGGAAAVGGLAGSSSGEITASYFAAAPDQAGNSQGVSSGELQRPTGYTGIYSTWDLDDPWNFGDEMQYPGLAFSKSSSANCPTVAASGIVIEDAGTECVYRPSPSLAVGIELLALRLKLRVFLESALP